MTSINVHLGTIVRPEVQTRDRVHQEVTRTSGTDGIARPVQLDTTVMRRMALSHSMARTNALKATTALTGQNSPLSTHVHLAHF